MQRFLLPVNRLQLLPDGSRLSLLREGAAGAKQQRGK